LAAACGLATAALVSCFLDTSGLTGNAGAQGSDATPGSADSAADGGDASALPFCQSSTHTFCSDFDEGQPVDFGWTTSATVDGGVLLVDDAAFSPPGSLLASTPAFDNTTRQALEVQLRRALPVATTSAHLDIEVRVDTVDNSGASLFLLQFGTGAGNDRYEVHLVAMPSSTVILEGTPIDAGRRFLTTDVGVALAPGQWAHVVLDVTFSPPELALRINGSPPLQKALLSGWESGPTYLEVGIANYVGKVLPPMQAHIDNVAIDVR
jgi:hypothetical protein